jgi:hypothetical protein
MKTTMKITAIAAATLVALLSPADASIITSGTFDGTYTSLTNNTTLSTFTPAAGKLYGISATVNASPFTATANDQTANQTYFGFSGSFYDFPWNPGVSPNYGALGANVNVYAWGGQWLFVNPITWGKGTGTPTNLQIGDTSVATPYGPLNVGVLLDTTQATWSLSYYYGGTGFNDTAVYQGGTLIGTTTGLDPSKVRSGIYFTYDPTNASVGGSLPQSVVSNFRVVDNVSYGTWAETNAGGQGANLDWDNDGVSNGVEYFMNAAAGFTANPALVGNTATWPNGGNIPSSGYGSQFVVQTSTDLANWSDVASDDITLSNTAGALTWKVASIANGDMGSFTGNLPSSWVVSGGALASAQSADNSPFTNKFAGNSKSWIIDDSTDASGSAGFLQAFSNKTNYPSVEVNFDFKLTELTGGTWGIQFDGGGATATASSSVHYRIDAAGQFAINAGPGSGAITPILTLEADKWYNVRATFTTTAVNTGSNNGAGVQSGTITPAGGSPVSWSNVPLLYTSLGFSRLLVRDRDANYAGDLLLDNVSVAPLLGKQFVRLKVTPN